MSHLDAALCPVGELCPRMEYLLGPGAMTAATFWLSLTFLMGPSSPCIPQAYSQVSPFGMGESCTAFLCEILLPGHEYYSACPNYSPRESLGTSCPPVLSTSPCHPPRQVTDAWEFSSLLCNIQLQVCLGCSQSLGKHILDPAPCAHF